MTWTLALRLVAGALGLALVAGEAVRSWGQNRMFFSWFDDVLIGVFLIAAAWFYTADTPARRAAMAAAWGTTAGMLYGSFFSKLFPESLYAYQSNIPNSTLTALVGVAFATSVIGLVTTLILPPAEAKAGVAQAAKP